MLDKEVQEKFLKEATVAAEDAEEHFRQYANALLQRDDRSSQVRSYQTLSERAYRCRQINGVLEAENLKDARLENIIEAFNALEEPEVEARMSF